MNSLKIATWNVNSLRVRLASVLSWLNEQKPDVLALQETKMLDDDFPYAAIHDAGYKVIASGQKTYNGVAILSLKETTDKITDFASFTDPQRRLLGVTIDGIRILNLYVPNGESLISEKYQYKLTWLEHCRTFLEAELNKYPRCIVLGDFNIAPGALDVHAPEYWEGKVLYSEPERQAFSKIMHIGFKDCFRSLNPLDKKYTWWDYRLNSFKRDIGLRIDHILASDHIAGSCSHCFIDKSVRGSERPSDHAPLIAEFQF